MKLKKIHTDSLLAADNDGEFKQTGNLESTTKTKLSCDIDNEVVTTITQVAMYGLDEEKIKITLSSKK